MDLEKDAKVFDVNEALNLNVLKMEIEVTGEWIVKEIQEWLLTQAGSAEAAVLPKDKTQCLLVGVCSFFHSKLLFISLSHFCFFIILLKSPNYISGLQPVGIGLPHQNDSQLLSS